MRTTIAGILCALFLMGTAGAAENQSEKAFDIGAQALASALSEFARQSQREILFTPKVVENKRTAGVRGKLEPLSALTTLLKDTGLTFSTTPAGAILVGGEKSSAVSPADQMRVAVAGESEVKKETEKGKQHEDDRTVIVEGERERPKPFSDRNVDLPRTIDDAQPYYIFDKETIARSGAATVEDFLKQRLTMNTTAATASQYSTGLEVGQFNGSIINLRGLGSDKTLVLINGRRMANSVVSNGAAGVIYQTNLNGIALEAIDRIEVLPSSASGIYGGGAVGGVVNVILKADYSGGQTRVSYDNSTKTDSARRSVSATYGLALEGGRTHAMVSAGWSDGNGLKFRDRRQLYEQNVATIVRNSPTYISSGAMPVGATTNISSAYTPVPAGTPGSFTYIDPRYGTSPELPNLLPGGPLILKNGVSLSSPITHIDPGTLPGADLTEMLLRNAGVYNTALPDSTQARGLRRDLGSQPVAKSLQITASRQMLPWLDAMLELSYAQNKTTGTSLPAFFDSRFYVGSEADYNPFRNTLLVTFPVQNETPNSTVSILRGINAGIKAQLPANWIARLDYSWSESVGETSQFEIEQTQLYDEVGGFLAFDINPLVDTILSPPDLSRVFYPINYRNESSMREIALRAAGPLFAFPWGEARLAGGIERIEFRIPPLTIAHDHPLSPADSTLYTSYARNQDTNAYYGEATFPLMPADRFSLVRLLELQVAGRIDRYEVDAGTAGFREYINRSPPEISYNGVTVNGQPYFSRDTYSSKNSTIGIRYQPLQGLTLRASVAAAFIPPDPSQLITNPLIQTRTVNDPVRGSTPGVRVTVGGNPDLNPQTSRSTNIGLIWEPHAGMFEGLRVNAEYYNIQQFDAIASLSDEQLIAAFPGRITRDASGMITDINATSINLYERDTAGWDLTLNYRTTTALGSFEMQLAGSRINKLKNQYLLTSPAYEAAGFHPSDGGAPKQKVNATLTWQDNGWIAGWAMRYISSYKQYGAAGGPYSCQFRDCTAYMRYIQAQGSESVSSQAYHDIYVGYTFKSANAAGSAGVKAATLHALDGASVAFGVRNLFDKVPPLDVLYSSLFYSSPYGDVRMRSYSLGITKDF